MNDKMKVWECDTCGGKERPCIFSADEDALIAGPSECLFNDTNNADWYETTRYEITERKPMYAAMAALRQFGTNGIAYGELYEYVPDNEFPFFIEFGNTDKGIYDKWKTFIPCDKPVERDPLTMEVKND